MKLFYLVISGKIYGRVKSATTTEYRRLHSFYLFGNRITKNIILPIEGRSIGYELGAMLPNFLKLISVNIFQLFLKFKYRYKYFPRIL